MANLLIILGAAAALGGLTWLAYVGSVMKGPKGNALVGGFSALVVGVGIVVLGTSIADETEQQFVADGSTFVTPAPQTEPTPTVEVDPDEMYRELASELASRAGSDLSRVIQLLRSSNPDSPIWANDVRQTSAQFARYSVRAGELVVPPGRTDAHEQLIGVLADLTTAGRLVIESLDAIGLQNIFAAQEALSEAIATFTLSSDVLADFIDRMTG